MAESRENLSALVATLDADPHNAQALSALVRMAQAGRGSELVAESSTRSAAGVGAGVGTPGAMIDDARKSFRERGENELVAHLYDVELASTTDRARRADLLVEKGRLLFEELHDEPRAVEAFKAALELRPEDQTAQELLAHIGLIRENWERIVKKYLDEAKVSTDRQLTTGLYLSVAESYARYRADAPEVESYLKKALEIEPRNRRAAGHLERILRKQARWDEVGRLLEARVEAAGSKEERVAALSATAELAASRLGRPEVAVEAMRKVLAVDPAHPRAMQTLIELHTSSGDWAALVKVYENALKARGRAADSELGLYLQIAMLYWKRLANLDTAEEYFRRVRKLDPAHAAMVEFYRTYYTLPGARERGEGAKLLQVLQQAMKSEPDPARRSALAIEVASLAESEIGNPEKAIDSWKAILRQDPKNVDARAAVKRLYQKTEKWNALLELYKEEIEALPVDSPEGKRQRVERLLEVVAIYRDRLNLDVMVINTYNNILALVPDHGGALDALAQKYEQLGRWNDLITVLMRKADAASTERPARVALLRRIAILWTDRFGNQAQAIKPLEELLAIEPGDREAMGKLKDIYTRRRQWRALLELNGRETPTLPTEQVRPHLVDMARLAADKLGDTRASINIWNRILEAEVGGPRDPESLTALALLYDKEKRYLALAEVYHRQRELAEADSKTAAAILEKLGALYADKLEAPAQAAECFREVLRLAPGHGKAMRILRDLYAHQGDLGSLEELFGSMNAWDDLIEVFHSLVDRTQQPENKLTILERIATLASGRLGAPEKATKAYERILAIDPQNLGAARALVPIYRKAEKWARLLSTYEVLLTHAARPQDKLDLHLEIRKLCEEKLGSKALAFQWAARAYELATTIPNAFAEGMVGERLLRDLERLGAEADAWEQVNDILQRRVAAPDVPPVERLRLLRELGRIRATRLHKSDEARVAWERVLELAPDDNEAMTALEDLATQQARWGDLLAIYRRRAELEKEPDRKLELLFKIAFIDEERAGNLESAAATYEQILREDRRSHRAIRALVKVQGARGDAAGLARALELDLEHATESDTKVNLLLRLGALYEDKLGQRRSALDRYAAALATAPQNRQVHAALERFLAPASNERVEVARLLVPIYERNLAQPGAGSDPDLAGRLAGALEILRSAETEPERRLAWDRRLVQLYGKKLKDPLNAYEAASRVLQAAAGDVDNRREMLALAGDVSAYDDLAEQIEKAIGPQLGGDVARDLWAELAELFEDRLEQPPQAERAWRQVLEIEPADERAFAALERLLRGAERWEDLRLVLEKRVAITSDAGRRKEILLQICDLYEGVLENAGGAMAAYRRVLDEDRGGGPASVRAYKALERLYDAAGMWDELEELLGRELGTVHDDGEHIALTHRRADIRARRLGNLAGAVDLVEEVLVLDPDHVDARGLLESLFENRSLRLRIARLLGPLYESDGLWNDRIRMLTGEREFAARPQDAVDILARVATLQEERLGDGAGAFITWREAVLTDPEDHRARGSLERLARLLDLWDDAAAAWEDAIKKTGDVGLRGTLLAELAQIYDRALGDAARATGAYKRILANDPTNLASAVPAAEALERLYDEQQAWPELIDILRKQAEWADAPDRRVGCLMRAAAIQEQRLGDGAAAVAIWREVLADDGDSAVALDALERLHTTRGEARELIEVLHKRAALAPAPPDKRALLGRVAILQEHELKAPAEAVAAYLEILDYLPDDRETLGELARLYRAGERWPDLLDVDERRLALAVSNDERAGLRFEIGVLLRDRLSRSEEALERFREILVEDASHERALQAVERMLGDGALKLRAAEILHPIYDGRGDFDKLVRLLELEAEAHDDPRERLQRLRKIAELRERHLDDPSGAFDAHARAARVALVEPELPEHLAALERLALARDRVNDLVKIYRELAPQILEPELQRRLYLDTADLARGKLGDLELARDYYRRVLDANPDDRRGLDALEALYRQTGEHAALREVLQRKADLAGADGGDLDERRTALAEIAVLAEEKLDRRDDAVAAWEEILEVMPADAEAATALERLYALAERWVDLAELVEKRLGFAEDLHEAVALRYRLGELYETKLHDPDKAVENYSAALGGDAQHAGSIAALERYLVDAGVRLNVAEVLEPIYISRQDWQKLIRITEIRLDAQSDPDDRLALTRRIARLYEEQLEDLEGAFRWYGKVFREDPDDRAIRDQLVRLTTILERWDGLARVYQEFLDDETGERPAVLEVARALGDIYDRRLNDVEHARISYRRVLHAVPDDRDSFARLEAMLTRAARWFSLIESYEEALEATLDDKRRKELLFKIADVHERRLTNADKAIQALRAVLDLDLDEVQATEALDRLYQEQKRWADLAELLITRIDRLGTRDAATASGLRVRLAEVQEHRLGETGSAIDQYQQVLAEDSANAPALAALERLVQVADHRYAIAQILEPIYRKQDWWQKLVVILDAELEFIDDKDQRVSMLREIARIHEARMGQGGKLGLALDALSRAWKEDVSDEDVYGELERVATKLGAWDQLTHALDAGVEGVYDYDLAARLLARIGRIEEEHRADRGRAIAAWRRVLEVKEDDRGALDALERLYAAESQPAQLVKVLEQKVELEPEVTLRKSLYARIAELYDRELLSRDQAIAAWRQVLVQDETDAGALDALERLYLSARDFRSLVDVLAQKIELAPDDRARRPLRMTAAAVHDNELHDAFEAIGQYKAILEAMPDDVESLGHLDQLYEREKLWPDLVEIIDRRAALELGREPRAELLWRAAHIVETEQGEARAAIERYRDVLAVSPGHEATRAALDALTRDEDTLEAAADALEPVYRQGGLYDQVAELYELRLSSRGADPSRRREQFAALAEVQESGRRDSLAAFSIWSRYLKEEPEDQSAQAELERLAAERGRWAELAALYESILDGTLDSEQGRYYSLKLAGLYEDALGDLERAAGRYRKALDFGGEEAQTLAALDRIYERQGKWAELADVLAREAAAVLSDDEQATFLYRLGDVRERLLGDAPAAIEAYRDVLERLRGHDAARAALERLLGSPAEKAAVIAILEPLYEQEGDHARLADVYEHKLSIEPSAADRATLLSRLAGLVETQLGDRMRALDAVGRWLAEEPSSEEAAAELERLAGALGRWEEAAARLHDVAGGARIADVERELALRRGRVLLEELHDPDRAEEAYRRALELDAQGPAALAALERIYRQTRQLPKLADILWRRAEAEFDGSAKRDFFAEVGRLREHELADPPGAVVAWRQVIELSDGDTEAHDALSRLYERSGAWEELVEILEIAARFAPTREVEVARRRRVAEVLADQIGSLDRAVDAWIATLDLAPNDESALVALAEVHRRREDWLAVQETLARRLNVAHGTAARVQIIADLARLAENERQSPDEAIGYLYQILDEDAGNVFAFDALEKLLASMDRWHDLADLLGHRAEAQGARGDQAGEVATLARAADIWETRLDNADAAGELLEKILARQPAFVPALLRLARIYEAAGDWDRCGQTLQRALALSPSGRDAADLYYRLGRVTEAQTGELAQALPHYQRALAFDPGHPEAIAALERSARDRGDFVEVAHLLAAREAVEVDGAKKLALAVELADLYRSKLARPLEAVPYLERAAAMAPNDASVLEALADLYFASGRPGDAEPLYRQLADKAKAARKPKEVARYQQRLGALREAAGDQAEALKSYEEAFRVDPSNGATMAGLGRIYFGTHDWEKARRVYRSMLLQNLDPSVGVSKADVYLQLGLIHAQLGETPKAKSMYERGLELEPAHPRLREAVAQIKA